MLHRFSIKSKLKQSSSSLPQLESNETSPTRSSSLPSPAANLTDEYSLALQTNSYNEIWSKIQIYNPDNHLTTTGSSDNLVSQVLQPNRELVDQVLHRAKPTLSTRLASAYFNHSEKTSHLLCLLLQHSIAQARSLYEPVHDLLDVLPADSLSQPQCNRAFQVFLQFSLLDNPFPKPISETFEETRLCFSELKHQLDYRLGKVQKQTRFHYRFIRNPAFCLRKIALNKVMHHIAQLEAARKGAYVLNNDLDTIDRLVARLHAVVESDKMLVRIGLERGRDRYPIQQVVKQLRKNHPNFLNQLRDLEEHVCLCFATVNRARSLLLQEIHLHQDDNIAG